jgi:hypothetical protein
LRTIIVPLQSDFFSVQYQHDEFVLRKKEKRPAGQNRQIPKQEQLGCIFFTATTLYSFLYCHLPEQAV